MKGYELSTDYNQLWVLIQEGYRVPAWINNGETILVEVKVRYSEWGICFGPYTEYSNDNQDDFINRCISLEVQFIVPNKQ